MRKRALAILLATAMTCTLTGCSSPLGSPKEASGSEAEVDDDGGIVIHRKNKDKDQDAEEATSKDETTKEEAAKGKNKKKGDTEDENALTAETVVNETPEGFWKCIFLETEDSSFNQEKLAEMEKEGEMIWLHLENGGKGEICMIDELYELDWDDKTITVEGDVCDYEIKGKNLTMKLDVTMEMRFEKTKEDLKAKMKLTETPTPTPTETPTPTPTKTQTPTPTPHQHTMQTTAQVDPTCEKDGTYAYNYCTGCGKYFDAAGNETTPEACRIPATGHIWVGNGGSPPSCTYPGVRLEICNLCQQERSTELTADPADLANPAMHITTYIPEPGNETMHHVLYCLECSRVFYDYASLHESGDPCGVCGYSGARG